MPWRRSAERKNFSGVPLISPSLPTNLMAPVSPYMLVACMRNACSVPPTVIETSATPSAASSALASMAWVKSSSSSGSSLASCCLSDVQSTPMTASSSASITSGAGTSSLARSGTSLVSASSSLTNCKPGSSPSSSASPSSASSSSSSIAAGAVARRSLLIRRCRRADPSAQESPSTHSVVEVEVANCEKNKKARATKGVKAFMFGRRNKLGKRLNGKVRLWSGPRRSLGTSTA
mmetsp:Transcript_4555/g.9894  ORF Transcript_4555/g.9894 Transcript_4555/m.9894 type:complete len:234 (+) Transcript_4555:3612-4313(+)